MKRKYFLLLILPTLYILMTGVFLVHWIPFYTSDTDPTYAYLFNGMTLAGGKIEIGHVDHPGTPVQCFVAIVIFIKHLFNHATPLYQDVIRNPESYLYTICTTISILFILTTWYTGYYIFKRTGKIILALLFQLTPILGASSIYGQNPQPESFVIIFGMLFMAYLYYHSVFENSPSNPKIALRHVAVYAVFTGFLIATKYTCAPLLLLVLFLLPTLRSRTLYVGLTVLFFLLFISPALSMWKYMFQWVSGLATHTGQYGSGSEGIINPHEFLSHFGDIFRQDFYFTSIYILLSIAWLITLIKRKQLKPENKIYMRLLSGVWVSSTFLILLVAKHYSFHYLLAANLCFPLAIAGSYMALKDVFKIRLLENIRLLTILFYCLIGFLCINNIKKCITYIERPISYPTSDFLKQYSNEPIIISADYQCSRIEPSLDFGATYTANNRFKYFEFIKKLYPNSYLYEQHADMIICWDDLEYTPELLAKYPKILVYFYQNESVQRDSILLNFCNWNHAIKLGDAKLIYSSPKTNEYIYELSDFQSNSKVLMANYTETDFDFDKFTKDNSKFISTAGSQFLPIANPLNHSEHHSGSTSFLLNCQSQYTAAYAITAQPCSIVNVSIWRKSNDDKSVIVFRSKTVGDFYVQGQAIVDDSTAKGWKQIEYKCQVPSSIKDSTVQFYLYYYGTDSAYFDDLSIKVYPMRLNNFIFAKKDSI